MRRLFRDWIIGKNNFIESWNEFRRIILSAQYALVSLIVISIYLYLEPPSNIGAYLCFVGAFVLILFSLVLHRLRQHCLSNILLFQVMNALIFLMGSSESLATGVFLFLIPLGLGLFSVFNYSQRMLALSFIVFSVLLFGLVLIHPFSILPFREYSAAQIRLNQLINFGIVFPVSVVAVYLLISMNYHNARGLNSANRKLSRLNEELDRFVYSTSHDLRAPLSSVKGLLALAQTAKPEEQVTYFHLINRRIESLDKFISDITDYSRNNRLDIIRESVNISNLATDIWESLQHSPDANGIEFINEVPEDIVVMNDARRMKVVLTNIISNAIRYHDKRKSNQYIRLYYQTTEQSFSLHVEDNG